MTLKEMLEKRAKCIADARKIYDAAKDREPTAEERKQFDDLMKEGDELKAKVDQIQADNKRKEQLEVAEDSLNQAMPRQTQHQDGQPQTPKTFKFKDGREINISPVTANSQYDKSFLSYLKTGNGQNLIKAQNALRADSDEAGGYTVPAIFNANLLQDLDNMVFIRQRATKYTLSTGESLGFPSLDADPADPTWTSELAVGDEDTTMDFGKRELRPYPLAQYLKVSKKLIRASAINVDALVRQRLAYKFGVVEESAFLTGSGAMEPLGIFTASSNGISTDRDVSTGNNEDSVTFDGLIECQYSLKAQYRNKADWLFHRDCLKQIRKLKDGEGRYIWQASTQVGSPDTLLGRPYMESEYVPSTFTTGQYVGVLGDFSKYWIADALTMTLQVLVELYALTNQNCYIGRLECDGMPVQENAFARVKLG